MRPVVLGHVDPVLIGLDNKGQQARRFEHIEPCVTSVALHLHHVERHTAVDRGLAKVGQYIVVGTPIVERPTEVVAAELLVELVPAGKGPIFRFRYIFAEAVLTVSDKAGLQIPLIAHLDAELLGWGKPPLHPQRVGQTIDVDVGLDNQHAVRRQVVVVQHVEVAVDDQRRRIGYVLVVLRLQGKRHQQQGYQQGSFHIVYCFLNGKVSLSTRAREVIFTFRSPCPNCLVEGHIDRSGTTQLGIGALKIALHQRHTDPHRVGRGHGTPQLEQLAAVHPYQAVFCHPQLTVHAQPVHLGSEVHHHALAWRITGRRLGPRRRGHVLCAAATCQQQQHRTHIEGVSFHSEDLISL